MSLQLALNDILEAKMFSGLQPGQLFINVQHYRVIAVAGSSTDLATLMSTLDNNWSAALKGLMNTTFTYFGSAWKRINPAGPSFEWIIFNAGAGTLASGDPLPKQVAAVVTKLTAGTGRAARGRLYLGGFGEADNTGSAPDPATITAINTAISIITVDTATGGANAVTVRPVIYHRASNSTTDITGIRCRSIWGTQKRRGDYGRVNRLPWIDA